MVLVPAWLVIRRMTHLRSRLIVLAVTAIHHADEVPHEWKFAITYFTLLVSGVYAFHYEINYAAVAYELHWPLVKKEWHRVAQTLWFRKDTAQYIGLGWVPCASHCNAESCPLHWTSLRTICRFVMTASYWYKYVHFLFDWRQNTNKKIYVVMSLGSTAKAALIFNPVS